MCHSKKEHWIHNAEQKTVLFRLKKSVSKKSDGSKWPKMMQNFMITNKINALKFLANEMKSIEKKNVSPQNMWARA